MGCGRSTLGSDSPRNSRKSDGDDQDLDEKELVISKPPPPVHPTQTIPFSAGGPLLAQAKTTDSQLSFFKMLDAKIENGPDCESEDEEASRDERLRHCLEDWASMLQQRPQRPRAPPLKRENAIEIEPTFENNNTAFKKHTEIVTDDEETSEAVKEQYMFMGNLYTLTRLRTDGAEMPLVDVSPAPSPLLYKPTSRTQRRHQPRPKRLQRADTPAHHPTSNGVKTPSRPASLVLRTVFPKDEQEVT